MMEGFFRQEDKDFITKNLFSNLNNPKAIAEVGNHTGNSTLFFSKSFPNAKMYSIDIVKNKLPPLSENVEVIIKNSLDWIPPQQLDFIYLDGDHSPEHVINEIYHFRKFTKIIAGHDGMLVKDALLHFMNQKDFEVNFLATNTCSSWIMRL